MINLIVRRVLIWVPSLVLILLGVYALAFFGAGDPIKLIFLQAPGDVAFDPEKVEAIREQAGLNRPFLAQFLDYLGGLLRLDFGNSLIAGRSVWSMIAVAAPVSLQLGLLTVLCTVVIAVPLGVLAALRQNTLIDYVILTTSLFIWAIPAYVAGPLMMVFLLITFPDMDVPYGWRGVFDVRIILPLITLSMQPIALIVRHTRSAIIDGISEDYVRTARAKGLPERLVVFRHLLRPAMVPIITQLGFILISIVNGAIFVELVFGLPGLGRLAITSMMSSDYPVILAVTLIGTLAVMVCNLLVDIAYPLLDPRAAA